MSYGAVADPARQRFVDAAIQKVVDVCRSSGIPCGTLANKENVAELIRKGYRFLIVPTEREFEAVRIGRGRRVEPGRLGGRSFVSMSVGSDAAGPGYSSTVAMWRTVVQRRPVFLRRMARFCSGTSTA
jgi:hypothetical protein